MKSITVAAAIALAWAGALSAQTAVAQSAAKSRANPKLSTSLLVLQRAQAKQAARAATPARRTPYMLRTNGDYVDVSAFGPDPAALRAQLESKGMLNAKVHDYSVSGRVPI